MWGKRRAHNRAAARARARGLHTPVLYVTPYKGHPVDPLLPPNYTAFKEWTHRDRRRAARSGWPLVPGDSGSVKHWTTAWSYTQTVPALQLFILKVNAPSSSRLNHRIPPPPLLRPG
jgi:hypothetical protein